jgi:hypothetical protein
MQSERSRLTALLDELQAAERAGATALERWIDSSDEPYLRGGLRVVRGRDLDHAVLARERLVALGATPAAAVRDDLRALCEVLGEPTVLDRTKLAMLVARYPNGVLKLFRELVARIEADGETRALLELVNDDDRVNLGWLRDATDAFTLGQGLASSAFTLGQGLASSAFTLGQGLASSAFTLGQGLASLRSAADVQPNGGEPGRVVAFLDALRAAEDASADVFAAWAAASPADGLRGGLVAIAARERRHATLLEERVLELGGERVAALEAATRGAAVERFGASDVDDRAKLTRLLDGRAGHGAAQAVVGALGADHETRAMLELIDATEQATFAWLRAYRAAMAEDEALPARSDGSEG